MINEILYTFSAVMPIADLAVVHEGPVLPNKWMAVASVDSSASGGADMSKKQLGANMCSERAQIGVVPSWQYIFKQSRCCALGVPSNAKSIAICDPSRLVCCQALAHNGMLLMEDQVFKVNFWTRVSNPSAHDDLG